MMYKVRACCDNCGFTDIYQIPKGNVFVPYSLPSGEFEDVTMSHYRRPSETEEDGDYVDCHNCGFPMLETVYWTNKGDKIGEEVDKVEAQTSKRGGQLL